jgi:hypothetical protein
LFRDAPQRTDGKSYFSREQKEVATEDKFFIEIYNNQIANGHQPSREEYRRYRLSQQRVKILESA